MKRMSFARRNALLPRGARTIPAALLGIAVLVFFIRLFFPNFFITLATPLWRFSTFMSGLVSDTSHSVENPATLARELQAAEENITALTSENTTLKGQVEDLQNLLGTRSATVRGILASVLSRPPESPYDTLVVDQGEASGVFAGALVTGNGRVPLGRVASVTNGSARVTLFSASGVKTDAWVGEKRLPVTLTGMGGGTFSATAPTDAKIVAGDTVFVLGGVAIGTVVRSDVDTSSPTAVLRVQSATNPFSLLWVLIARPL